VDIDRLLGWAFDPITQAWDDRMTMLYALCVGIGADPVDNRQLRYVTESDLVAFPTMALTLATAGPWIRQPEFGIDWKRVLHGEQQLTVHRPLPSAGAVTATFRVTRVDDKGADVGALVHTERTLVDARTGELVATTRQTTMCRGDGGFGGNNPRKPEPARPKRPADAVVELATMPTTALFYRLTGDRNPIHNDPATARAAGFDRPILHGLCTFGIVAHALVRSVCDWDGDRLASIAARFASPVYPGELIRTAIWLSGANVAFEATGADGRSVITRGAARVQPARLTVGV
jgi:acyl dehydratase